MLALFLHQTTESEVIQTTPKEYLSQYEVLKEKCLERKLELLELRQTMASIGSPEFKERVQSSGSGDQMSNRVIRIVNMEQKISDMIDEMLEVKHRLITEIHELDDADAIKLLYKRYIECKRLEQISCDMNFTYQYVREMHGNVLEQFKEKHPEIFNNLH